MPARRNDSDEESPVAWLAGGQMTCKAVSLLRTTIYRYETQVIKNQNFTQYIEEGLSIYLYHTIMYYHSSAIMDELPMLCSRTSQMARFKSSTSSLS